MTADAHYPGPSRPAPAGRTAVRPAFAAPALAAVVLAALLSACASGPSRQTGAAPAPPIRIVDVAPDDPLRANEVLMRAIGLVGTPYRWGGNTPAGGFDCSGLVGYVFLDAARLPLPRTTGEIARVAARTPPRDRLAPGDLVLFAERGQVFHVGIYVGEGRFVHAPSSGGTVRLDRIDSSYWSRVYAGARRLLH